MDSNWEYWKKNAGLYDRNVVKQRDALYSRLEDLIRTHLGKDMDVLELCSGSGNLAKVFSSSVHSWIGVDYSDEMVKEAREMDIPNASFLTGDAQDISFTDASFDAVVNINALQVIPCPGKCLEETKRVLKDGGILLCSAYVQKSPITELGTSTPLDGEFMSYHNWTSEEFMSFVEDIGFHIVSSCILDDSSENVCFVFAGK